MIEFQNIQMWHKFIYEDTIYIKNGVDHAVDVRTYKNRYFTPFTSVLLYIHTHILP